MGDFENSLLSENFEMYYSSAKKAEEKGNYSIAKKNYLLAAETLLKMAKISSPALKDARVNRAKSIMTHVEEMSKNNIKTENVSSEVIKTTKNTEQNFEKISLEEALNKLYSMEGLSTVKEQVGVWVDQIKTFRMRQERNLPVPEEFTYHLVFRGKPGTGKTTVARLMSQIYCALGILSKGHLVEVGARDLVAGFVGQTAIKTKEYIQKAMGGVLFIDEAYLLDNRGSNDFGQEAIGTLLKEMEDNRGNFIVIVAGYKDEMDLFIQSNTGLKSRFSNFIDFDDYTGIELFNIFKKLCDRYKYVIDKNAQTVLQSYFNYLYDNRGKDFANGREVRNLFEKVISNNSVYVQKLGNPTDKEFMLITIEQLPKEVVEYYNTFSTYNQFPLQERADSSDYNGNEVVSVNDETAHNKTEQDDFDKSLGDQSFVDKSSENKQLVFSLGGAFRPTRLDDYVGQPMAVNALKIPIATAKLTATVLPHILLNGPSGVGKTTLARIVSNEMGGDFKEISYKIKFNEMIEVLKDIKKGDIIFIDEIHGLSNDVVESLLYPAMEDFKLNYTVKSKNDVTVVSENIPPFTLIGATTETGKLLKPFFNKFPIKCYLQEYSEECISNIIQKSFFSIGIGCDFEIAKLIAKRSRLNPRRANEFVLGIKDYAIVDAASRQGILGYGALKDKEDILKLNISLDVKCINDYFSMKGIDEIGLMQDDIALLKALVEKFEGGPAGVESLAKSINVSVNVLSDNYEPYLVKIGFIDIRPQGRYITEQARKYLDSRNNISD